MSAAAATTSITSKRQHHHHHQQTPARVLAASTALLWLLAQRNVRYGCLLRETYGTVEAVKVNHRMSPILNILNF